MSAIDNLVNTLRKNISECRKFNRPLFARVYAASQNYDKIRYAVAEEAQYFKYGKYAEGNNLNIDELISDLYLYYTIYVDIIRKPLPDPNGDFISIVNQDHYTHIYWDLDRCESIPDDVTELM